MRFEEACAAVDALFDEPAAHTPRTDTTQVASIVTTTQDNDSETATSQPTQPGHPTAALPRSQPTVPRTEQASLRMASTLASIALAFSLRCRLALLPETCNAMKESSWQPHDYAAAASAPVFFTTLHYASPTLERLYSNGITTMQFDILLATVGSILLAGQTDALLAAASEITAGGPIDVIVAAILALIAFNVLGWFLQRVEEPRYFERAIRPSMAALVWLIGNVWHAMGRTGTTVMKGVITTRLARYGLMSAKDTAVGVAVGTAETVSEATGSWLVEKVPDALVAIAACSPIAASLTIVKDTIDWFRGKKKEPGTVAATSTTAARAP